MKLTVAQEKALQAVARGEVTYYAYSRINNTGRRIFGYRKDVVRRLVSDGLIALPNRCELYKHTKYILTPAGREVLEQVRCKK